MFNANFTATDTDKTLSEINVIKSLPSSLVGGENFDMNKGNYNDNDK